MPPLTIRVVSYAINGRGMGHLVRQLAILRWVRRYAAVAGVKAEVWLLTSSEADTLARREGIPALKIPSKSMMRDAGLEPTRYLAIARTWVLSAVATLQPDVLVVDTFPGGSFGELVPVLELARRRVLVARAVKAEMADDPAWKALLPLYDRVIVPGDDLDGAGAGRVGGRPTLTTRGPILLRESAELLTAADARSTLGIPEGKRACLLTLGGGGDVSAAATLPRLVDAVVARGWHAVAAAGPLYEGPERRGPGVTWLERYASQELLRGVDAAISAGGYNSTWELALAGVPTVFLPQPRLADDQSGRVARVAAAGLGVVARTVGDAPALLDTLGPAPVGLVRNGAREAAAAVLALVLPPADVAMAQAAWSDDVLDALRGAAVDAESTVTLLRLFGGESPSAAARRESVLLELRDRGIATPTVPARPAAPVRQFIELCTSVGAPVSRALPVAQELGRRFPVAGPAEVLHGCLALWPSFGRWADWMGAHAFIRALPTQRDYALAEAAPALARWLGDREDAYEAQRALNAALEKGAATLAEVLRG